MSPRRIRAGSTTPILRAGANAMFAGRNSQVSEVYERLTSVLRSVGPVTVETKRTSIHLIAGSCGSAFAGVHPQKSAILLNIRSPAPIESPRVRKVEQVSKNRFHNEVLLASPDDVNGELLRWLKTAYDLASSAE
jgi:hypothetical protein